jgi:hypothetical protein
MCAISVVTDAIVLTTTISEAGKNGQIMNKFIVPGANTLI